MAWLLELVISKGICWYGEALVAQWFIDLAISRAHCCSASIEVYHSGDES